MYDYVIIDDEQLVRDGLKKKLAPISHLSADVIDNVQAYITRYYYKDISLELVASLFYLNRCYLSSMFRERTGMKFIDFLTFVRIEKAKQLLVGTDFRISQIAAAVGYSNAKYFFRLFKKQTGKTPEQFRQFSQHLYSTNDLGLNQQ